MNNFEKWKENNGIEKLMKQFDAERVIVNIGVPALAWLTRGINCSDCPAYQFCIEDTSYMSGCNQIIGNWASLESED